MMFDSALQERMKWVSSSILKARLSGRNKNPEVSVEEYERIGKESLRIYLKLKEIEERELAQNYLMSAGSAFIKSENYPLAINCFNKLRNENTIYSQNEIMEYIKTIKERIDNLDTSKKEGRLILLNVLVWKHQALNTKTAREKLSTEISEEISPTSVLNYAKELKRLKRIELWGGPQGRLYHMYPDTSLIADRSEHYGKELIFEGEFSRRVTDEFQLDARHLTAFREMFEFNGSVTPKIFATVDYLPFLKMMPEFLGGNFKVRVIGRLHPYNEAAEIGFVPHYKSHDMPHDYDVLFTEKIINRDNNSVIYESEDFFPRGS